MGDTKQNRTLAKVIAYMLGKAPEEFGLVPDNEGFVKIKELLQALHEEEGWGYVRAATLNELVMTLPDVPFEMDDNRIRARGRNSPAPAADAPPAPRCLYTCIREKAYPHVLQKGITPTTHRQVVLCGDRELAERIGGRRSPDPVTLTVHTEMAEEQGVEFHPSGEGIFLADYIPAGCFSGPALREKEKKQTKTRPAKPEAVPAEGTGNRAGTFLISPPPATGRENSRSDKIRKETDWKRERKRRSRGGHQQWPDD